MTDTDALNTLEILALTAVGESDGLGEIGMQQTINTVMNRVAADLHWMGGNDPRAVCLKPHQYDCWDQGAADRARIMKIGLEDIKNESYQTALRLAEDALSGNLPDITNGAVSYGDHGEKPSTHPGSQPCLVVGDRVFYNLEAVS